MAEQYVLALDIGASHVSAGLVNREGRIELARSMETPGEKERPSLIERLHELTASLLDDGSARGLLVQGISIGSPGIVNTDEGVIVAAGNIPELFGARIGERFREAFGLRVLVENDVNALALGEMLFGVAKGVRNFVVFALGTDLGGGIVVDGKLLRGSNFIAAEFGHLTIDLHGQRCFCGGYGCFREYVSGEGLAERARESFSAESLALRMLGGDRSRLSAAEVFRSAEKGDVSARELIEEFGRRFGALVANVMKVLDPELVILGGEVCRTEPGILNLLVHWTRHYYFPLPELPRFKLSEFSKSRAILGPAAAFFVGYPEES
jgi:predicted NBD/HSP70 family sugar kinase